MTTQAVVNGGARSHSIAQILHHCTRNKNLRGIKAIHGHLLITGLFSFTPTLQTKIVLAYATCLPQTSNLLVRTLTNSLKCLNPRNPLLFNSIISGFCEGGFHSLALHTFSFMHLNGVYIDSYALCSSLTSASCLRSLKFGQKAHAFTVKSGWFSSVYVGCAMIDLYAKLQCINDAAQLFDEIPVKNSVCANALISGYTEAKMWAEALPLARKMPSLNLELDNFTFSAALHACAGLSAVELGMQVHGCAIRKIHDMERDVFLQSLLIELYGKCGLVEKAMQVFNMAGFPQRRVRNRDLVLWTSMLGVLGKNGNYEEVIRLFREMLAEGIKPDGVAFLTVISACSHTGQVNLGMEYFESMARDYGLEHSPEHYSCLIDLLCRAGELNKAWKMVEEASTKGNSNFTVSMWGALLNACNDCGNVELGKFAAQRAIELDPNNDGIYVLLSNLYARNCMWNEIEQLREFIRGKGLKKDIGSSWIDIVN
nr:pentatricopeptide repeat-containing protein At2g33680-like [Ipomoea trifida]